MNNNEPAQSLNNTVIANGYCVGCGACASLEDSPYKMSLNKIGQYEAELKDEKIIAKTFSLADEVCPFSSISSNEDELSKELFGESCDYDTSVGFYHSSFAGYVKEGSFRAKGSSGGFGTWILQELLRTKTVDYIINVQANTLNSDKFEQPLFSYSICSSASEIQAGSKSRYYPIELSDVLTRIRSLPGTYAIVGLPCFIKSIRLLQRKDSELAARIRFCIGLVCGHLKSTRYAQSLAWQSGIVPSELQGIDFRVKNPSGVANRYSTSITGGRSEQVVPTHNLFGTDWGSGAFKYKACDFCDDVFAETADVVVGDAWLPKYVQDGKGTNILVVRNQAIQNLIATARDEGRLMLDDISVKQARNSQDAGFRHRRGGLGLRLFMEIQQNRWVPPKRIKPTSVIQPSQEKKRQELRVKLRELSHQSFNNALDANDLNIYLKAMSPVYQEYKSIKGSYFSRGIVFIKRVTRYLRRKLF